MYDVDGNGVIDQDEMTKIIQVSFSTPFPMGRVQKYFLHYIINFSIKELGKKKTRLEFL